MTKFVRTLQRDRKSPMMFTISGEKERQLTSFSFPVPNTWYINVEELDYENAKDGQKITLISSPLFKGCMFAAVSNDVLICYSFQDIELMGMLITPNWALSLRNFEAALHIMGDTLEAAKAVLKNALSDIKKNIDEEGYYRYMVLYPGDIVRFKEEIQAILKINIPRSNVNVTELTFKNGDAVIKS